MASSAALIDAVIDAMAEVSANIILPRFNHLSQNEIRAKTHAADLVTIADEEAERDLTAKLLKLLPGSKVVGEEAVAADPAALPGLLTHDPIWIVDPIDGTMNFIDGKPLFAVMIALVSQGETVLSWIHDPLTGRTLWAEKGKGAWRRPPQALSKPTDVRVKIPAEFKRDNVPLGSLTSGISSKEFSRLTTSVARVIRQGCAGHDYWAVAEGRMHLLAYRRLKPWDHAGGVLIHQEAGGYSRLVSGEAYSPVAADQHWLLCAPTAEVWERAKALSDIAESPAKI